MAQCVKCHYENPEGAKFCRQCGTPLPDRSTEQRLIDKSEVRRNLCPRCGAEVREGMAFCVNCGQSLKDRESSSRRGAESGKTMLGRRRKRAKQSGGRRGGSPRWTLMLTAVILLAGVGSGAAILFHGMAEGDSRQETEAIEIAGAGEDTRQIAGETLPMETQAVETQTVETQPANAESSVTEPQGTEMPSAQETEDVIQATETPVEETEAESIAPPQEKLPYTDNDRPNTEACESADDFAEWISPVDDKLSIRYPKSLFNRSTEWGEGCSLWYETESGEMLYQLTVTEMTTDQGAQGTVEQYARNYENELVRGVWADNKEYPVLKRKDTNEMTGSPFYGTYSCSYGGYRDEACTKGVYAVITSDGSKVYHMRFDYDYSNEGYTSFYNHINYIYDSVYRGCSFSLAKYKIRSYQQFMDEDLGSEKQW